VATIENDLKKDAKVPIDPDQLTKGQQVKQKKL
jgi:hypothetical protein